MNRSFIRIEKISKCYDGQNIFKNLSFSVKKGEILAIIGHSGCGKTTLLRILGGFEAASSGRISIAGKRVSRPIKTAIMIFQDFAQLFPWQTVIGNIVWPMLVTKTASTKNEAIEIAREYLTDMGLSESNYTKYPVQLSGGMKQRVAVARALALKPKVLLMDEPFGAIDNLTRKKMQIITRNVCEKHNVTAIIVTHSITEAVAMSDKILVFCSDGKIKMIRNDDEADSKIEKLLDV